MDINSLLSPSDPPVKPANAAQASASPRRKPARPTGGKRTTSTLSQEITLNSPPPDGPPRSAPSLGFETIAQAQRIGLSSASFSAASDGRTPVSNQSSPLSEMRSPFGSPQVQRPQMQYVGGRTTSNPQMEPLADLAAMQQQQPRHASNAEVQGSTAPARHNLMPAYNRTLSSISSSDIAMAEAPASTPEPRVYTESSMSEADLETVTALVKYLSTNSYAYESHVQLINLLHQGFLAHVSNGGNAAEYSMLTDLRQAREAMDTRFAVGEAIWKDWINDEALIARTGEERMSITEQCRKAVQEEPSSVVLWQIYGEWILETHRAANGYIETNPNEWAEEDKMICSEVFTREVVLDVWERAVEATKWRIDESNRIWDRYIDLVLQEFPENPSTKAIDHINTMFITRLQLPHATWSETSSKFWPIVSKHNASNWEEVMAAANEMAQPAKQQYGAREVHEMDIKRASDAGDLNALYNAFAAYLKWEKKGKRNAAFSADLRCALHERALLRFPTMVEWWLDYVDYVYDTDRHNPAILPILERATRHCPWSGELWSKRILRSEIEHRPYEEVGNVKHKATNSGLMDIGGMEEVLKVYVTWCSYLRRRAFDPNNTDDEVDMAEMGFTGTLEDASVAGKKIYGDEYKGDPLFRLEKIHVKFLTEARRLDDARAVYKRLIPTHSNNADFWVNYYTWEILVWAHDRMSEGVRVETPETRPHSSSIVLEQALSQRNLDWPERIIDLYARHFQENEVAESVEKAEVAVRNAKYYLALRREKEAADAAAAAAAALPASNGVLPTIPEEPNSSMKRKRDDTTPVNGDDAVKRSKTDDASAQIKRDREHNVITIKDLPADIAEKRIRQFFSDCGKILSVNIVKDDNAMTAHAALEFETHEDALAAKTRDGKRIDGNGIRIQAGTLSTLYVTNYPPDYDEAKLRDLFEDYGSIVSVRLPSLKFNQRRRFAYVQFLTAEEARAATVLNNKSVDRFNITVLISDPDAKKTRGGATSEGREIHVSNVEFTATEADIRDFFEQHGKVVSVRVVRNSHSNRPTGSVFVIYSTADEARSALALNQKPFKDRLVRVNLATDKSSAHKDSTKLIAHDTASGSPEPNDRRTSVASAASHQSGDNTTSTDTARTKKDRTVALLYLPDTVNDARIQSVMGQHGPLHKISVISDKEGALVEYVNLNDAGKVGLGVDISALGPNVRVGTYQELMAHKPKKSTAGAAPGPPPPAKEKTSITTMRPAQAAVARPAQKGPARRGGLGFKRGGFGGAGKSVEGEDKTMTEADAPAPKVKSNADFRTLFEQSKEPAATAAANDGEQGVGEQK